jgi:hypothetical protein
LTKLNVRLGGDGEHGGEGGVGEAPTFNANVVHFENMKAFCHPELRYADAFS